MQKYELHTQVVPGVNLSFWWGKEEKGCPNTNIQVLHIHVLKPATPGSACWTSQPLTSGSVFRLCGESREKRVRVTAHRGCAWAGEGSQFTAGIGEAEDQAGKLSGVLRMLYAQNPGITIEDFCVAGARN